MIFNSLDIDFIHGDIHGRSCKKNEYSYPFFGLGLIVDPCANPGAGLVDLCFLVKKNTGCYICADFEMVNNAGILLIL